jgi:hypothetical protein
MAANSEDCETGKKRDSFNSLAFVHALWIQEKAQESIRLSEIRKAAVSNKVSFINLLAPEFYI